MAEIMEIAQKGALKTEIMYKANLSFSQLNDYIKLLTSTNLLNKTAENGRTVYRVTEKGRDFLSRHEEIMGLLNEDETIEGKLEFHLKNS